MPNLMEQHRVSQSLSSMPFANPYEQYIYSNFLEPLLFGISGLERPIFYALYTGIVTVAFLVVFIGWFITHHGEENILSNQKVYLAALFPVFAIPFYWIGMDGMTLLLLLIIMINLSRTYILLVSAVLLGMQHFEQGLLGLGLLIGSLILAFLFQHVNRPRYIRPLLQAGIAVVGLVIGKLILIGYFQSAGIIFSLDRFSYTQNLLPVYLDQWKMSWPYILYSVLAIGWIIVLSKIRLVWPLIVTLIIAFFMMNIVGDQTRVICIVTFPSLFYWVLMNKDFWNGLNERWVIPLLIVYFTVPFLYVWGGPFTDLWRFDVEVIRDILDGRFSMYGLDYLKPFKP